MEAGHAGRTVNDIPTTGCMALVFAAASPEQKASSSGRGVDVGLQLQVVQKTGIDSLVRSSLGQPNNVFGRPAASTQHQSESENQRLIESENSIAPIGRIALEREEKEEAKCFEKNANGLKSQLPTCQRSIRPPPPGRAGKTDMHFSGSIDKKVCF
uniref:Uncharacterized protein n=1 Tax=Anopheles melas TaxID=34690 RepID=A0A182TQ85_9DIPT